MRQAQMQIVVANLIVSPATEKSNYHVTLKSINCKKKMHCYTYT